MAVEYQNMFNSHTLSDDEKSFIAKTLNVSGDLLTTMINYIETVKCRKKNGTIKDLEDAIRQFNNIGYFADLKFDKKSVSEFLSIAFPLKKREEKPKVKKEFDPLDYHNMAWLKKKKADPYYGRDKNGKVYSLMDVLPDRSKVGNDEYFKTFREKVMNIINPIIDLGDIDLSKVPPKALAYMMDILFRDKVWGVIGRKADEKIKATSFDDCVLALEYNNVNFSFDFKNGKYTLATTATD